MIRVFEVTFESSVSLRKALGLYGSKWCEKADIKDLLRMAFPESTDAEIKKNLQYYLEHGKFKLAPVAPSAIYTNYKTEFGCSLPFDLNGIVYEPATIHVKQQEKTQQIQKPKVEVMNQQNDEYTQIKKMLLNEIALIQNAKNYTNADGEVDVQKADMLFKRAEAVNNIAGSLNDMRRTEIEAKKLQLDAVKTALSHGYDVKVNGNLLGVEISEQSR